MNLPVLVAALLGNAVGAISLQATDPARVVIYVGSTDPASSTWKFFADGDVKTLEKRLQKTTLKTLSNNDYLMVWDSKDPVLDSLRQVTTLFDELKNVSLKEKKGVISLDSLTKESRSSLLSSMPWSLTPSDKASISITPSLRIRAHAGGKVIGGRYESEYPAPPLGFDVDPTGPPQSSMTPLHSINARYARTVNVIRGLETAGNRFGPACLTQFDKEVQSARLTAGKSMLAFFQKLTDSLGAKSLLDILDKGGGLADVPESIRDQLIGDAATGWEIAGFSSKTAAAKAFKDAESYDFFMGLNFGLTWRSSTGQVTTGYYELDSAYTKAPPP